MHRVASALLATLLIASRSASGGLTPDRLISFGRGILETQQTIILVRVVEVGPVLPFAWSKPGYYATVLVLKSWKGPFSAGRVLHVVPADVCMRANWDPYLFQAGDNELLMFTGTQEPIVAMKDSVWPAAESQALMRALDQAVKEELELQDPQTDITRAPERHRVMLALKECFAEESIHPKDQFAPYSPCHAMDLSVLTGIKRSELVAYWGPPTLCVGGSAKEHLPPTRDCPPEQASIWTFGHPGNNLWCNGQKTLRCMGLGWVSEPTHASVTRAP